MLIAIPTRRVTRFMGAAILALALLHGVGMTLRLAQRPDHVRAFLPLLDLDAAAGIGTWYAASALLVAAGLAAIVAREQSAVRDRCVGYWRAAAAFLALMSADEIVGLHERLGGVAPQLAARLTARFAAPQGELPWSRSVAGAALAAVVGLAFLPFLLALPRRYRRFFLLAGALFVAGAVGLDAVGAVLVARHGIDSVAHGLCTLVGETLELSGVAVAIHALLRYIAEERPVVHAAPAAAPRARGARSSTRRPRATPTPVRAYTPPRERAPRPPSPTPSGRG